MTAPVVETAAPFAPLTCQALTAAVLRLSAVAHQSAVQDQSAVLGQSVPRQIADGLRELAATDPAWASWAGAVQQRAAQADQTLKGQALKSQALNTPPAAGISDAGISDAGLRDSADLQSLDRDGLACWPAIAARLPELLIRYSPAGAVDSHGSAWRQLIDACHVVLRLHTLEQRFADELQRQKREAIYHFAYGLSHELNNPLANIATRGGVLAAQELNPQRKTLLEAIVANAMRGCEMLGDLMLVARPPKLVFKATRIDRLVSSVVEAARPWAQNLNTELSLEVQSTQDVELDAAALREALWALLRNGLEAMFDGGTIAVSVTERPPRAREPQWVCIEISDRGSGMSQAALEHCFDPYYSGREAGRGLGLGLSKAQRIIELHRGQVTLANLPGGGAVARILLPAKCG